MPKGEDMFKFHGYSGPCPKPPVNDSVVFDKTTNREAYLKGAEDLSEKVKKAFTCPEPDKAYVLREFPLKRIIDACLKEMNKDNV